jgi:hypothetical protein
MGCWSEFKDQREELSYLESLSNPTPSQWKRREELKELRKQKDPFPPELNTKIQIKMPEGKFNIGGIVVFPTLYAYRECQPIFSQLRDEVLSKLPKEGPRGLELSEAAKKSISEGGEKFRKAVKKHGSVAMVRSGEWIKVLDFGDDYAHVHVFTDDSGTRIDKDGYTEKWWSSK